MLSKLKQIFHKANVTLCPIAVVIMLVGRISLLDLVLIFVNSIWFGHSLMHLIAKRKGY